MDVQEVIFHDKPKYSSGVKIVYIGIPIIIFASGLASFVFASQSTWPLVLVGIAIFYALLFWFAMPKEYQIMRDKYRIIFGFGYKRDMLFRNIDSIGSLKKFGFNSFLRCPKNATIYPFNNVLAVKENKSSFEFLSPNNLEIFYEQLSNQIRIHNINIKLLGL